MFIYPAKAYRPAGWNWIRASIQYRCEYRSVSVELLACNTLVDTGSMALYCGSRVEVLDFK